MWEGRKDACMHMNSGVGKKKYSKQAYLPTIHKDMNNNNDTGLLSR